MEINKNISIKGDFWGLFLGIVLCVFFAACDSPEKGTDASPSFNPNEVSDQSYIQGRTITPLQLPQASGGDAPLNYSLSPLPAGLDFDISTQMLTGTPSASLSSTDLTYTVQDADGETDTIMFSVEVVADLPLSFTRAIAAQSYSQGRMITPLQLPQASGGRAPLNYSLSPVPAGLEFDPSTRRLTGTPSALLSSTDLTYTVQDADGDTDTITFSVEVVANLAPSFSSGIAGQIYTHGVMIDPLPLPQASGGNAPLTYRLSPVPAGLDFNISTQMLTGTPSASLSSTDLTYTVQDADGDTDTITFSVEVVANPVPFFKKEIADQVYIQGIPRGPVILPEAMGGDGELTYSLEPLPDGMIFDSSTRELSGSPSSTILGSTISVTYTVSDEDMDTAELMFNIVFRTPQTKDICGRTQQVREAIIAGISGTPACDAVTELQLAEITILRLDADNFLNILQEDDFEGLSNLRELHLWSNQLRTLPEDVFEGLTSLQTLGLRTNQLRTLPEDMFEGLTSLQTLELRSNFLETLPEDVFDCLTSLQTLDLSYNEITTLPEDVFEGLTSLQTLDLSYNKITTLPEDVFDGLTSLTHLDLRNNALDATPAICSAGVNCILLFNNIEGEG